jgi:hypothetical protein
MLKRLIGCLLAVGLLAWAPARASLMFAFETEGTTSPTNPACTDPFAACSFMATGAATATSGSISPLPGPWTFTTVFALVEQLSPTTFRLAGTFSFDDPSAANNDFSGLVAGVFDAVTFTDNNMYRITAGSGLFAGGTGFGSSIVQIIQQGPNQPLAFTETGQFSIGEPGSLALLGLGVMALAWRRWRGKRAAF